MLVLARKIGEQVIVNGNIVLVITEIRGNTVRLGIQAPREVSVHRAEVRDRIDIDEATVPVARSTAPGPLASRRVRGGALAAMSSNCPVMSPED